MPGRSKNRLFEPRFLFKATAVNHICYSVSDYARSRDFYRDLFGMDCIFDDGNGCTLTFGRPSRALSIEASSQPDRKPFYGRMGFSVAELDLPAMLAKLKGLDLVPQPEGDFAFSLSDPEGFRIWICSESAVKTGTNILPVSPGTALAPAKTVSAKPGVFKATAVNHISYHVSDYAVCRDFYVDLLGMTLRFEDGKKCSVAIGDPEDAIYITPGDLPEKAPRIDHLGISIREFDLHTVEEKLKRLGLNPEPDGDFAWTILDPDGLKIQVCAEKGVFPGAAHWKRTD